MADRFKAISISYKKSSLELREKISLGENEIKALYLKLKEILGIHESLIISTCNRTEIYYSSEKDFSDDILKLLTFEKNLPSNYLENSEERILLEEDTIKYLFEVSLGIHSQVLGDMQIPNQIKQAYQWSADAEMAGPFLHRLMHSIFYANKRIVQETEFRDGAASTSYAAVELMEAFLSQLKKPNILLIGLGEIGQDVCETLADKGYKDITLCNRSLEKSEKLATQYGFKLLNYEDLSTELLNYNIIISSVRTQDPIITKSNFETGARRGHYYLFDLSVPRSIDPAVSELSGIILYELDEIQKRTQKAISKRTKAIPKVENIISEVSLEFQDWTTEMGINPTINKLKGALEQIRKEEIARYLKNLSEEEAKKVEIITSSMMQKIIKLPVLQLKAACKRGEAETLIDVLNNLFDLEKENSKS